MSQALANNLIHNPFFNRFNDPVTHRRDEMQSNENVTWLRERNENATSNPVRWSAIVDNQRLSQGRQIFAKLLALFRSLV